MSIYPQFVVERVEPNAQQAVRSATVSHTKGDVLSDANLAPFTTAQASK
jgi:hypothetical protein